MIETAKLIYVFDMFIANTGRGHQRDNIQSYGSRLLIYNHELACSFLHLLPFLKNETPWILNEADRDLYRGHIFYRVLKELKPALTQQVDQLQRFNQDFWDKAQAALPPARVDAKGMEIQPYLTSIVKSRSYFAESLNKTLAM